MHNYSLVHISDAVLLRDLAALVARDRLTTAELLAHIAEVDARRLYVPAGYSSMHAYCVDELRLSEDAAAKRIQAARAARRFPGLFTALAEGRLHLSGVWLLAPHLAPENADELIEAATHRRKAEIEALLARRFPAPEAPALVRAVTAKAPAVLQHAPGHVGNGAAAPCGLFQHAPGHAEREASVAGTLDQHAPGHADGTSGEVAPPTSERFLLKLTISKSTHDKLRYAQALLSHAVPSGDVAQVLDRALDTLIKELERRKIGGRARTNTDGQGSRPRRTSVRVRYIPAQVRRAVWERDQGQCTFVSASGHRCNARRFLEFDHADPVARGGRATVDGIRLRCRAHNQHEAERAFGAGFMARKRQEARLAALEARVSRTDARPARTRSEEARARAEARGALQRGALQRGALQREALQREALQDVLAGLRSLGCRAHEARRAAEFSQTLRDATLEERMRAALKFLGRRWIQGQSPGHP